MRARSLILILFAVLLAGGTAILARSWLAAQKAQHAEAAPLALPPPGKSVLVARGAIERGQILKPSDLVWQPWPSGNLDPAYVQMGTRTPASFTGSVAREPLTQGQPITVGEFVAPGNRGFLAAVLRPGMRAISVPITATSGISGFVFPGDQVDIMITHTIPGTGSSTNSNSGSSIEHKATETILHDVRVIGIDQRLSTKEGQAIVAHTATLEVTPKQAEMVELATEIGKLSLSLRSLAPAAYPKDQGDSHGAFAPATYTLDSQVSQLLPKPFAGRVNPNITAVTILRGDEKGSTTAVSLPQVRGD
jgi:pilus assembly protein CpaB